MPVRIDDRARHRRDRDTRQINHVRVGKRAAVGPDAMTFSPAHVMGLVPVEFAPEQDLLRTLGSPWATAAVM